MLAVCLTNMQRILLLFEKDKKNFKNKFIFVTSQICRASGLGLFCKE
jgi:hypothetical protein